ncbi:MAG: hypothetical protein AB8I69_00245, partial [Anaerolineae bacterium]
MGEEEKSIFAIILDFLAGLFGSDGGAEPASGEEGPPSEAEELVSRTSPGPVEEVGEGVSSSGGSGTGVAGEPELPGAEPGPSLSEERGQAVLVGKGLWAYRE